MSILRFRITFDDYDDIQRDIDFKADQTFADLFIELLKSVGFDNKHKGTFWLADHNWRKGTLIGEIQGEGDSILKKTELVDHIDDPHQKFMFTYDEDARWNFNIELIRVMSNPEYRVTYPKVSFSVGIPPVQYKEILVIPTRERTEPDGRGRKPKAAKIEGENEDDLSLLLSRMTDDEDEEDGPLAEIADDEPEADPLELPDDLELETDNEIAKLAEEFNNTIETNNSSHSEEDEDDSYGGFGDDDDELGGGGEDDEYGSGGGGGYGRGGGSDYDE